MCVENIQKAAIFGVVTIIVGLLLWWIADKLFPKTDKRKMTSHIVLLFLLGFISNLLFHYMSKHTSSS
jgi:uncharacterized membrane protein YeaQ/YmgE (transglycosylase-associated protein family)